MPKNKAVILLLIILFLASATMVSAAPKSELWERWLAHDPGSNLIVNHSLWDSFLAAYRIQGRNGEPSTISYNSVDGENLQKLESYLTYLQSIQPSALSRVEQMAYWLNLYNARTVYLILEHYPVRSIRDIKLGGLFSSGPWDAKLLTVENQELSLNDIEHRILRPIWQDARIHYVVNCASYSCPDLPARAITALNAEQILDEAARSYVNSARGASLSGNRLTLSSIYNWYAEDFGDNQQHLIAHLIQYADTDLSSRLQAYTGRIRYDYDWRLNE
ncbi:MAG: DUF547 domain-containing protein [Spirochaetes bacterium]|nr:DUF547 domain-containing protein [Spirochaetota bacterium]